jgi:hypothetical protein
MEILGHRTNMTDGGVLALHIPTLNRHGCDLFENLFSIYGLEVFPSRCGH